jgi:hypothetical protein
MRHRGIGADVPRAMLLVQIIAPREGHIRVQVKELSWNQPKLILQIRCAMYIREYCCRCSFLMCDISTPNPENIIPTSCDRWKLQRWTLVLLDGMPAPDDSDRREKVHWMNRWSSGVFLPFFTTGKNDNVKLAIDLISWEPWFVNREQRKGRNCGNPRNELGFEV